MGNFSPKSIYNNLKERVSHIASENKRAYFSLLIFLIIISFSLFIQVSLESNEILRIIFLPKNDTEYLDIQEKRSPEDIVDYKNNNQEGVTDEVTKDEKGRVENLEVNFYGYPVEVEKEFDLFEPHENWDSEVVDEDDTLKTVYRTADIINGKYIDPSGSEIDLSSYNVFVLDYGCMWFRILAGDFEKEKIIISYGFDHPSCSYDSEKIRFYVYDVHQRFNDGIFWFDYTEWQYLTSDLGYSYAGGHFTPDVYEEKKLVIVDTWESKNIYQNPDSKYEELFVKSPEGFFTPLYYIPEIYEEVSEHPSRLNSLGWYENEHDIVIIRRQTGDGFEESYTSLSCEENCKRFFIDKDQLAEFEIIGEAAVDGSSIYVKKDLANDPFLKYLYEEYYVKQEVYKTNNDPTDDFGPIGYVEFRNSLPVIYWKDPFGNMLRFIRTDFINIISCCFAT
jgi:hypothetical protein